MRKKWILWTALALAAALLAGWLLLLYDAALLPSLSPRVTVLMYHDVVPDGSPTNGMQVTASRFEADMRWLQDNGYTTVLPRELASGEPLPDKAVMVTLDDGYAGNYNYAFPVLQKLNMKAAIAVVVSLVDQNGMLSWDMCREMSRSGLVEIGTHTYNLHNLDGRSGMFQEGEANGIQHREGESLEEFDARVLDDLRLSIERIEDELGEPVTYMAYPFGAVEPWAEEFIQEHLAVTVTTHEGTAYLSGGLYELPRKMVSMFRSAEECFQILWRYR